MGSSGSKDIGNTPNIVINTGNTGLVGSVSLINYVSGVLPIGNGGTNSSTSLSGNRFIISSGGGLREIAALGTGAFVKTDTNGLPTVASISLTNDVFGILPQGNLTLSPTFDQASLGSVTVTSSAIGSIYKLALPGSMGTSGQVLTIQGSGSGQTYWSTIAGGLVGSVSLTNQISGILPQANLTLIPTFTQATLGSITITSSAGGVAATYTLPGRLGLPDQCLSIGSGGALIWQYPSGAQGYFGQINGRGSGSIIIQPDPGTDCQIYTFGGQLKLGFALLKFPQSDGSKGQFMKTDGSAGLSFGYIPSVIGSVTTASSTGGNTYTMTLPGVQGSGSSVLVNNGLGAMNWVTGVSGSFTSQDGKTITVTNGLITAIV